MDQRHVTRFIGVDYTEITIANKMLVDEALEFDNWDRLVILEEDMIAPLDALSRIALHHAPEQAIVGSVYFQHPPPHYPVALVEYEGLYRPLSTGTVQDWCSRPGLYQVDAVGFGLTSIARHVLENWPQDVPMFATDAHYRSHDLHFCNQAKKQGHHIFLDTGIVCDHLSFMPIGMADNLRYADGEGAVVDFDFGAQPSSGADLPNGDQPNGSAEPSVPVAQKSPKWATYAPAD